MQGVALGQQHFAVQLFIAVAGELEIQRAAAVEAGQFQLINVIEDLGLGVAGGLVGRVAEHPVAVVQKAVQLHVADGHQTVEPGVGHGIHHLGKAVVFDAGLKLTAQPRPIGGIRLAVNQQHVPGLLHRGRPRRVQPQPLGALGDGGDEVLAGLGGVFLECGFVHSGSA